MVKRTAGILMLGIIINLLIMTGPSYAQEDTQATLSKERLNLKECLHLANEKNQGIERARSVTAEMEAERRSARGRFGPLLRLDANAVSWDSPFEMPVDLDIGLPIPPLDMLVRDKNTAQYSATVIQPITGLRTVYAGYKAQVSAKQASAYQEKATRNDVSLHPSTE